MGFGLMTEGTVGLGHRRLSIIDLSECRHTTNALSLIVITITYNGEIFNYIEVKDDLLKKGYAFSLRILIRKLFWPLMPVGQRMSSYFDGMFAFAIWDQPGANIVLCP